MNRQAIIAATVVFSLLAVAGGGLAVWKYRQMSAPAPVMPEMPSAVDIVQASMTPWQPEAELVGTVIALRTVTLSNELAGTIRSVHFESGSIVNEGDVLLTLDATTQEADLKAAQASVLVAEAGIAVADAQITLAESNVRRLTQALAVKAAAETDVDRAQADLAVARAERMRAESEVTQAKARAAQIQSEIAKLVLKAPFKARAGLRSVHPGQYLAEGTQIVGLQGVTDQIFLDFGLPQEQAQRVKVGDVVMAQSAVMGKEPVRIEVVALDATANPTTRNVRLRAIVDNRDQRLRPGMFVDVKVPVGQEQQYVTIPLTAVRRASFGDHVFVVAPDASAGAMPGAMRAQQRFITLGPALGELVIVLKGLDAGTQIAGAGSFKLREGALVMQAPPAQLSQSDGQSTGQTGGQAGVATRANEPHSASQQHATGSK